VLRYLLLVVATALLAGCHCTTGGLWGGCGLDQDLDWEGSHQAAGPLWEAERDRTERTWISEVDPDTAAATDSSSVLSAAERTHDLWWFFAEVLLDRSSCSARGKEIDAANHLAQGTCSSVTGHAE